MANCHPEKKMSTEAKKRLTLASKQSWSSEYLTLYFVFRKFKRSYDASQNLW